jgi:hypothetical protein
MNKRRSTLLMLAAMLILACSCPIAAATAPNPPAPAPATTAPGAAPATAGQAPAGPPAASATTEATASPSATPCSPIVTATMNANVRKGPGMVYGDPVGNLLTGQTATVAGQNAEGTWWYIIFAAGPGGHGWIAASTVTASCLPPSVAVITAPDTPTAVVVVVTDVSVSVSPDTIGVPGCMGPIPPSTVSADITVNGAIKLNFHFVTQQNGPLSPQSVNFKNAMTKNVSDSFVPPLTAGNYWVRIVIDGMDLSGMSTQAKYKISC